MASFRAGSATIFTLTSAEALPDWARTRAVPGFLAVTRPPRLTGAIAGVSEVHSMFSSWRGSSFAERAVAVSNAVPPAAIGSRTGSIAIFATPGVRTFT